MTVGELWDSFNEYPGKLRYYNGKEDKTIHSKEQMVNFINKNADEEVLNWNYSHRFNTLFMAISFIE